MCHLTWQTLTVFLRSPEKSSKRFVTHIQLTISVFSSHPIPSQAWDLCVVVSSDTITLSCQVLWANEFDDWLCDYHIDGDYMIFKENKISLVKA